MFERFTNRARHVVVLAQEEARQLQHNYIGTEHILLGLLGEPEGVGAKALDRFGMTREGTRDEVRAIVGTGPSAPSGHIPFTPRAKKTLELALREALQLHHNYIGTEHILLGLLGEPEGVGAQALDRFGMTRESTREEVRAIVGTGPSAPSGHIPFTPRAKKTLELALREALQLHHNYIGTEHILLGVIREGDGVGAQVLRQHADLLAIRDAVLDLVPAGKSEAARGGLRMWLRRRSTLDPLEPQPGGQTELRTTPAADTSLSEAAKLAGGQAVGSHHLLLAALTDPNTAAAKALGALGIDLDQAREALRRAEVTGTSDEQPEDAGRRQMLVHVADDKLTVEFVDPVIVGAGKAALRALGDEQGEPPGTIGGDQPAAASLSTVWLALHESLGVIQRRATLPAETPPPDQPGEKGSEAA
jgi:ATP-dependent Clp protease ATP-binding subunit ClpA